MFRWLLVLAFVCAGTFALVKYYAEYNGISADVNEATVGGQHSPENVRVAAAPATERAGEQHDDHIDVAPRDEVLGGRATPIVIPAQFQVLDKQEVPSERDGKLLVIGTEVVPGDQVPPERRFIATVGFLVLPVRAGETVPPSERVATVKGEWRRWHDDDPVEPERVKLYKIRKEYKRLEVGDEVRAGQIVALVDPELALTDLAIKVSTLDAAEADRRASQKTMEEAERRVSAMEESNRRVPGSVSKDDYEMGKLTAKKYHEEEISKRSAVIKAQQELIQAQTIVAKHEIHATISGIIKVIYKNRGDAVKTLEPVMQIQSRDPLRVDGLIDVQYASSIKPQETVVVVEPTQRIQPKLVLEGHLGEVTCVAVGRGAEPVIVSGSEDQSLRGWDAVTGRQRWMLSARSGVRSVACTGKDAAHGLALVGCSDGSARIIDLDKVDAFAKGQDKEQPRPLVLNGRHQGAVYCVAFSPDGKVCATGGADRNIYLWNTETGERLNQLVMHRAPVTSLQFTPGDFLISAGQDSRLVVWSVAPDRPPVVRAEFIQRGGDVGRIGASPDGKQVLFDQGKEIRVRSLTTGQVEGVIRNASGTANFTTMALFDPDGLTVLTNASDGRLQLWRAPTRESTRAAELRQLAWARGAATSAAFSPDGTFCVTGTTDHHVLVWLMPERRADAAGRKELVETPIRAVVKKVEEFIDSSNSQVRIWAEVRNKDNRLVPGGTATMVVLPEAK